MGKYIPLSVPNLAGNEQKYVKHAIAQTWVSTGGAYVTEFERQLAGFLGVEQVAACQSGTSALHLSLAECGVRHQDVVIVPALTFIAAVNPVLYQSAEPVFMDCDDSLCMDPVKLRAFCEQECAYCDGKLLYHKKHVKALVIVHVFGNMADMEALMDIAKAYRLTVIEDATEALGTRYESGRYAGKYAGTIGDFGAFSFNGNKIITTGGGGAVTAKNPAHTEHMRYLSAQAKDDPRFYIHHEAGYNYRMTNLQAALGVAQMEQLPAFLEIKQKNYVRYQTLIADIPYCELLPFRDGTRPNYWFYSLNIHVKALAADVRKFMEELEHQGIQTRMIWGLIHEQKPYKDCYAYQIRQAVAYGKSILNLPCSTNLTEDDVNYVSSRIRELSDHAAFWRQEKNSEESLS